MKALFKSIMVGAVAPLLFVGCSEKKHETVEIVRPVKTVVIESTNVSGRLVYPGKVTANKVVELAFEVDGPIIEVKVKQGDRVKKGQLIARIDPRDYKSQLEVSLAQLTEAKSDYERYKSLVKKGAVSKADFDVKNKNYKIAINKHDIAKKALDDTNLRVPFDGIIAEKFVENFQNVNAKQKVFMLQDEKIVNITISVPEQDMAKASKKGTPADRVKLLDPKAIFPVAPDKKYSVKVKEFQAVADSITQTFKVVFQMPSPKDIVVRSGMTAEISVNKKFFTTGDGKGFKVPFSAIFITEAGKKVVWKVSGDKVTAVAIQTNDLKGDTTIVTGELKTGDKIVTAGASSLREGMKIKLLSSK